MPDRIDILEGLRRSGGILEAFVRTIPAKNLNRIRADGCWSIAEHVSHLAQVQPMLLERILRFMREDEPEFIPYIPGQDDAEERLPVVEMPLRAEHRPARGDTAPALGGQPGQRRPDVAARGRKRRCHD